MENCKVTCFNDAKIVPNRWFGITGDNGMCITFQEGHLIEAIRALINVEIVECPNELVARNLVYKNYISRFIMRNSAYGIAPKLPANLPTELLWVDKNYDERERQLKSNIDYNN